MPICSRCGVDQPPDAFSEESHPLCETCYEIELEEEAAGGAILPQNDDQDIENVIEKEGVQQDMDQAEEGEGGGEHDRAAADKVEEEEEKPHKPIPLSNVARLLDSKGELIENDDDDDSPPDIGQLEDLVNAIEARGYSNGYGLDSKDVLRIRLQRVLFDPENLVITWLTKPLVQALLEGPTSNAMTIRIVPLNRKESVMEGQTLLHWLVQWKLLQIQCGWRGHDDFVDLILRAGASAQATLQNGCTPIFFAVKYGSVDTVRLLIEQGKADPLHKDCRNQTCLRNALPQASPYILKYLLQHLPPDETFVTQLYNGNPIRINALDVMVTEFVTPHVDVSWATLGMPYMEDYAMCMLMFLRRGVQISPHYPDVTHFLGEYIQGAIPFQKSIKRMYYTRKVADLLLGQWLPLSVRDEVLSRQDDNTRTTRSSSRPTPQVQKQSTSPHPQQQNRRRRKRNIDEERYNQLSQLSLKQLQFECEARNLAIREKDNKDHCVRALVADWSDFTLSSSSSSSSSSSQDEGGKEDDDDNNDDDNPSSRLMAELTLSHTMISEDNYLWVASSGGSVLIPITLKGIPIMALLSTTSPYTMVSPRCAKQFGLQLNTNLQTTLHKPLKFVRAEEDDQKENATPINNNPNLAPAPPKPTLITAPQIHLIALTDFSFTLGQSGIQVQLSSAVQVCEPTTKDWPVGVVLGMDFLGTAAWAHVSVEVDLEVCLGRTVALLTSSNISTTSNSAPTHETTQQEQQEPEQQQQQEGLMEFDLIEPKRANRVEEDLRYYAKDGKLFWTPLWHVSLSKHDVCLSLGQYLQPLLPYPSKRNDVTACSNTERLLRSGITQCAWCGREFPFVSPNKQRDLVNWILSRPRNTGMIQCPPLSSAGGGANIPTFYCDEKCQQHAMAQIHSYREYDAGGADLPSIKSAEDESTTLSKRKVYIISLGLIVLIAFLINSMLGTGQESVQNEMPSQSIHDDVAPEEQSDSSESEL